MGVLDQLKNFWDDSLSDASNAYDLYSTSIQGALQYDAQGPQTVFTAIVLTDPFPLDPNQASLFFASSTAKAAASSSMWKKLKEAFGLDKEDPVPPTVISKFIFKARIDGPNSPHSFLPDPCSETYAKKPETARAVTALYTTFISTEDYISGEGSKLPRQGDLVNVRLSQNVFGYNLVYGEFLNLVDTSLITETQAQAQQACETLFENFDPNDVAWSGRNIGGGGSSGRKGMPGETRNIDFSSIKHENKCSPNDESGAPNAETYFGKAVYEKWRDNLGGHEGTYDGDGSWNSAGYIGRYQMSIDAMISAGYIHSSVKAGLPKQVGGAKAAYVATYEDDGSWTGTANVKINSLKEWQNSKAAQDDGALDHTNGKFARLIDLKAVDLDNAQDVAGMLGMAHLKGADGAAKVRHQGIDKADGKWGTTSPGGTFPSAYYIELGKIC